MPAAEPDQTYDIAIIGGGSAAEALVRNLDGSGRRIVMFEPALVGGECPFLACIPSKAMLHDRTTGRDWDAAVARRQELTSHLDDSGHAEEAEEAGATIVRSAAKLDGPGRIVAGDTTYLVDDIVIATGATPVMPDIDGLDADHDRIWTSADALTAIEQPASVVIIGGGVIGSELAFMFAGFDTRSVVLDSSDTAAEDLHPRVSELIASTLERGGVEAHRGVEITSVELTDDDGTVHLADGSKYTGERIIVAVGRRPAVNRLGLETIGVDAEDVDVDDQGRLSGAAGVWLIGDVAGKQQYTHVANHHAAVVAELLTGAGDRSFSDVVAPACIFIDPPVMIVGPTTTDLADDPDVLWAEIELETPRDNTDEHDPGFLAVAARRSTGCIIAANGIGAHFDEIIHALVVAIDGRVPISRLIHMMQPFPTVGEVLGQAFTDLDQQLSLGRN